MFNLTITLIGIFIIMLVSGTVYNIVYREPLVSIVIGSVYLLALFGLHCIYVSYQHPHRNNRWLLLIAGFLAVMISYVVLEFLYRSMY